MFATYPMAFHTPGGGEVQLLAYEQHLPQHGVDVTRLDPWAPRFLEHDLVHFFSCMGGSLPLCSFVKQLGLPLVVTSSLWMTEESKDYYPLSEIRAQLGLADRVITNSVLESEALASVLDLPRDKFADVPNAVDAHFLPASNPRLFRDAFGMVGPFALCVANIEPRKNQVRLAAAMAAHPNLPLLLLGQVRDPAYWREVQAVGNDRVQYLGHIDHASPLLASAYAACSVFVLPSLFETPGLAALEASAQGAPIVITRGGSTTEYFGEHAHYVDPLSVESIAAAITAALESERQPQSPATWSAATGRLAAIYRDVVTGASSREVANG